LEAFGGGSWGNGRGFGPGDSLGEGRCFQAHAGRTEGKGGGAGGGRGGRGGGDVEGGWVGSEQESGGESLP